MDAYDTTTYEQTDTAADCCCCAPAEVEPIVEPIAEPVVEPTITPVAEPTITPVAEPTIAPVAETSVAPVAQPDFAAPAPVEAPAQSVAVVGGPTPGVTQVLEPASGLYPTTAVIGGSTPGFTQGLEPASGLYPTTAVIGGPTPGISPVADSGLAAPTYAIVGQPTYEGLGATLNSGDPHLASTAASLIAAQQSLAGVWLQPSASELRTLQAAGYR